MPEKRKTETEPEVELFSAKRARQQLSYADLDDTTETGPALTGGASHEPDHNERDGHESTGYDDDEVTENPKVARKQSSTQRQNNNKNNTRPRVDPVYGQRSAFPGLDDLDSGQLFYGPAEDGLEYLRMVRSEANSLPSLFVASKSTTQIHGGVVLKGEDNQDEITADASIPGQPGQPGQPYSEEEKTQDGFILVDGVVIGTISGTADPTAEENRSNAQSSYHKTLQHRFVHLQRTLRVSPPAAAISKLDDTHPITFPYHIKKARLEWRRVISTSDPQMVQLACMDMETVLNVLRLIGDVIFECIRGEDVTKIRRAGAWAWGLLGRCRDVGELSSEEVGELRYIGRQAVSALVKLNKLEAKDLEDESMASEPEDNKPSNEPGLPAETTETATMLDNSIDDIVDPPIPIPTTESLLPLGDTETTDDLEAAKLRLQSRLQESVDREDQELRADMAVRRRRNTSSPLVDDEEEEQGELEDGQDEDIAPEDPTSQNTPQNRDSQSRALLDMIITVVGEFYGQKDLLLQRDIWQ
ncbi:hypothetical protein PISL3812_02776 [Talaromyces islandicus]|uniref:Uncharacterized protein n=1 Tax=Talaromyces islandicus TaxID=28573 RepID=A0A0U1LQT7_TALIS|nr:hypothetical protein PISL3812_02776 [Talaromyces islandicus]